MSVNFRADLLTEEEVKDEFVESIIESNAIEKLLSPIPLLLEGSRGCGKTMLLKKAKSIMSTEFNTKRELPVFISFSSTILVEEIYFQKWMIAKILIGIKNALMEHLHLVDKDKSQVFQNMFGIKTENSNKTVFDGLSDLIGIFEKSNYENTSDELNKLCNDLNYDVLEFPVINDVGFVIEYVKKICQEFDLNRVYLFIDEASHNFLTIQQRKFFEFFRNLTCEYIVLNAAVYPGITSYGDKFQLYHDADIFQLNRKISDENYVIFMRDMLSKKIVRNNQYKKLEKHGELLDIMIYASAGNPRTLIKSLIDVTEGFTKELRRKKMVEVIKDYYISDIWNDHSELLEKYPGHSELISWGREYIDNSIIDGIISRINDSNEKGNYFAIDKENSKVVQRAFSILEYSGIVMKDKENLKKYQNGKNRFFTRYQLNLGILIAKDRNPIDNCKEIINNLSVEKCYWVTSFPKVNIDLQKLESSDNSKETINTILNRSVDCLEISDFLLEKVQELNCHLIKDIINKSPEYFKKAKYVGDVRSDKIYDEARAVVLEYISG